MLHLFPNSWTLPPFAEFITYLYVAILSCMLVSTQPYIYFSQHLFLQHFMNLTDKVTFLESRNKAADFLHGHTLFTGMT